MSRNPSSVDALRERESMAVRSNQEPRHASKSWMTATRNRPRSLTDQEEWSSTISPRYDHPTIYSYHGPLSTPDVASRSPSSASNRSLSAPTSSAGSPKGDLNDRLDSSSTATTTSTSNSSSTIPATTMVNGKVKKKRIRIKTERRREQCRLNQARYRQKQKTSATDLENAVQQLRIEVMQLQQHQESLHVSMDTRDKVVGVVREYFRLFRYGLSFEDSRDQANRVTLNEQVAFVLSTFNRGLTIGDGRGHAIFLEQMRRYSNFFDDVEFVLIDEECVMGSESHLVNATYALSATISLPSLRFIFPHLLLVENEAIREKLLDRRLECSSSCTFVFDTDGHIIRMNWTIDFVRAFQALLPIEETALVLDRANIAHDAYIIITESDRASMDHEGFTSLTRRAL